MEIYLARHTTPKVDQGVCYGQADLDLVEGFEKEIANSISQLPVDPDLVVSSPLKRCKILAETYCKDQVVYDPDLMEYNFGKWELLKWDDIPKKDIDPWMKDFVNIPAPGGESLSMMHERVNSFWERVTNSGHSKVVLVSHSGVIRIIKSITENTPLKDVFTYKMEYGAVFKITI